MPDRKSWMPNTVVEIAAAIRASGGRALLVGGAVRDELLGRRVKDLDLEVFHLSAAELERLLSRFGEVVTVGRAFGVFRVKGIDVDFSLPRRDSKVGSGHRGFEVRVDPDLDPVEAARRRDLTINSISKDPLTGEILDPYGGQADLEDGRLRATDPVHFVEDPLRALRVAQFAARFEMHPDEELERLCAGLDLGELPGERVFEEFRKLLLLGARPSLGFEFLAATGLIRFFPELEVLIGTPQDPRWHPEGDVWIHTLMALDAAARLRDGGEDDEALMFGVLCHDLGKPETTRHDRGRVRSGGHEVVGADRSTEFLTRIRASNELIERVGALVREHLTPSQFAQQHAGPRAYRRLARRLARASVSLVLLARVARADHLGRTTEAALHGRYEAGDVFLDEARALHLETAAPPEVVQGRHLIERGLAPGREFGRILARCRDVYDETGWDDPERILDRVLAEENGQPKV